LWRKFFRTRFAGALGVAVDSGSNVLVTGYFSGPVDFGGGSLASAGDHDIFVVKLATDGSLLWSKRFGGPDRDQGQGLAVTPTGDSFGETMDFGGGPLTSAGSSDVFVLKLRNPQ
jgi:hypothetical protein